MCADFKLIAENKTSYKNHVKISHRWEQFHLVVWNGIICQCKPSGSEEQQYLKKRFQTIIEIIIMSSDIFVIGFKTDFKIFVNHRNNRWNSIISGLLNARIFSPLN